MYQTYHSQVVLSAQKRNDLSQSGVCLSAEGSGRAVRMRFTISADSRGAAQPTPFAHGITLLAEQDEHCGSG